MTEPTLIERLNLDHDVLLGDLWDDAHGNEALRETYKVLARNTKEAITALKERDWVKIDDPIVETWKDGREVELWVRYLDQSGRIRLGHCNYRSGNFATPDYDLDEMGVYATHVMLPPQPPKG